MMSFNPTLVRLRPNNVPDELIDGQEFQSHAGSIEAERFDFFSAAALLRFNPTLVRLRPAVGRPSAGLLCGFNPTLVRLRHVLGVIGRGSGFCFNPTLVRLRLMFPRTGGGKSIVVSIPRWFD